MPELSARILPLALCLWASAAHSQGAVPVVVPTPKSAALVAPKPAAAPKIDPRQAQQMVERILKETSVIRQLSIKSPVRSGVKTQAQIEEMVKGQLQDNMTTGEAAATELFLKQVGLAPANFDVKSYYVKMLGEQIAGYYDTKTKTFYTIDHVDPRQLETVMSHELTHALQDQHFNLGRLDKWPQHDSDGKLAMSALVEGDATFTMMRYTMRNPMRFFGVLASTLSPQSSGQALQEGPHILSEVLTFPYIKGMAFVSQLYQKGGWSSISGAFNHLPQSTEQIMHFDKYEAHEAPVEVSLRDVSPLLGKGWALLDHDVNGELGLELVVGEHLKDQAEAEDAAAGWAGDRYEVYRGPNGADLTVQDTVWDSDFEAQQWAQAYAHSRNNRFKVKPQARGALQVWNAAPNGVWMERRGRRVLILEGTVGAFNPTLILAKLWQ